MAEPDTKTGGLRRGGRVLLYVSLALNFLVVGLVVGALVTSGPKSEDRRPARGNETGLGPVVSALEPQDRRQLGIEMRRALRRDNQTRAEIRARMDALSVAMRADPFQPSVVETIIDEQFTDATSRLSLARDLFVERLGAMSAEERATFAERLDEVLAGQRGGPGAERRDGPPPREKRDR